MEGNSKIIELTTFGEETELSNTIASNSDLAINNTLTDDANCSAYSFVMEVSSAPCGATGTAWVTIANGVPSYKVHIWGDNNVDRDYWVDNSSFQITDIITGSYSIKIIDANGCEQTQTFSVKAAPGAMDFALEVTAAACGSVGSAWVCLLYTSPSPRDRG